MAMSFSRPDPSSPSAVAAASFATARRGYDQAEVRDLLRMVAAEMARLQEREKFLERELRSAQRGHPNASVVLDDEVVTRMLGEEAARILHTAREAASQIKIRAEESSARLLREATDESQRLREEAEVEAARRRQDASSDAESELQMAKQQGRDMVNEARAYRERVLGELARRREMARQQIEQLVHGRDRLLQAFERARLAAVDVMAEMTPLGEPTEYVNLSPITGPVPLMVPNRTPDVEPEPTPELAAEADEVEPVVEVVETTEMRFEIIAPAAVDHEDSESEPEAAGDADDTVVQLHDSPPEHDPDEHHDREPAPVVELFGDDPNDDAAEAAANDNTSVNDLFARLRASHADAIVERVSDAETTAPETETTGPEPDLQVETESGIVADVDAVVEGEAPTSSDDLTVFQASPEAPVVVVEVDDSPFGRRDEVLTPIIVTSARKLKRVLADEQNDVLHSMRRPNGSIDLSKMLPSAKEQAKRYADAIASELEQAAKAGAASIDASTSLRATKAVLQPATDALASMLVQPLRERLQRAIADSSGDHDGLATSVRSIYRDWKTQRIDEHLDDVIQMAFGRGALAVLKPGTPIVWTVDPNGPACPDAEDNSLAGVVAAGDPFPTDHVCAPAHPGCRCMLALADR